MTSGQIVGKMDTQKQLNVPLEIGTDVVIKTQVLAGGRGLGHIKENNFQGGVHVTSSKAECLDIGEEGINTKFCPLQEKFHPFVLRRLRNISEAP
jgi:succinyl-CoA synthetase beta subunit